MDLIAGLRSFLTANTKVVGAVALACLFVLAAPARWLKPCGIDTFRDVYQGAKYSIKW